MYAWKIFFCHNATKVENLELQSTTKMDLFLFLCVNHNITDQL